MKCVACSKLVAAQHPWSRRLNKTADSSIIYCRARGLDKMDTSVKGKRIRRTYNGRLMTHPYDMRSCYMSSTPYSSVTKVFIHSSISKFRCCIYVQLCDILKEEAN